MNLFLPLWTTETQTLGMAETAFERPQPWMIVLQRALQWRGGEGERVVTEISDDDLDTTV